MDIYSRIEDFCKTRNTVNDHLKRFKFITSLLDYLDIPYEIEEIKEEERIGYTPRIQMLRNTFYNIYVFGSSKKFLSAHHDIVETASDNANDDSASIINMIAYRLLNPYINLIITDGEEPPYVGIGSLAASKYLMRNNINVEWILNLELTGKGRHFFIDNEETKLSRRIENIFEPKSFNKIMTPFNDSMIFREHGFESNVITTTEIDDRGKLDMSILYKSHTALDSLDSISINDMKYFTEITLDKIVNGNE